MCSLLFENNLLSSEGVRFASISKKTPLSKLSFAFVSLALPLLVPRNGSKSYCPAKKKLCPAFSSNSGTLIVIKCASQYLSEYSIVYKSKYVIPVLKLVNPVGCLAYNIRGIEYLYN